MSQGNLLIIDDEVLIVTNLKITLEDQADKIFVAYNGLEALEILKTNEIHCIICDINMPKMNGVEFIKRIREDKIDIPLIFYTGHGNQELMMEAAKYGAFDFLDKPNLEGLEDVVAAGLKAGLNKESTDERSFESDYQKLLKEID